MIVLKRISRCACKTYRQGFRGASSKSACVDLPVKEPLMIVLNMSVSRKSVLIIACLLLSTLWILTISQPAGAQTTGLVAYWQLDEPAGATSFLNSAGAGDTGSCSGSACPSLGVAGKFGTAANFVGGNQRISIGSPSNLNFGTGSFSYALWVYVSASTGPYDMPWWKGGGSAPSPGFDMELGTGNWTANVADGSHIVNGSFGSETDNQWIFLVAVVDRSSRTFKTYRNGSLVGSASLGSLRSVSSSNPGYIGGLSGYGLNGKIDDVMIYNVALTGTQVASLYGTPPAISVAPSITTQPTNQTVTAGQSATFTVAASGTAPLSYQWSKNGTVISQATSASYTTPVTTSSDNGSTFAVVVTNSAGNAISNTVKLTVAAGLLSANPPNVVFGAVTVGTGSTIPITISANLASVAISNVTISGPGFTASGISSGLILNAGQSATLNLTFTPSSTSSVIGTLTIGSNASDPSLVISASGSGLISTISVSPTSVSLPTGGTQQFAATLIGITDNAVTWSATGGTISSSGLYTSPSTSGSYTVTATSAVVTSLSASATVTATQGNNWYVSQSGTDSSSCGSSSSPCASISYVSAARVAPGDTVHVNGTFNLNGNTCILTAASGTSSKPITYMGDPYGSAKINGQGACYYVWHNTGNYVNIYGFDFTGVQAHGNTNGGTSIILSEGGGGNVTVAYNTIHDLPSGFAAAIDMEPYGSGNYTGAPCSVHDNILSNLGYNGGLTQGNYGMYIACGTNTLVYNNLIYNEGSIGIHCWHAANNVHIWNNTIFNAQYIGIIVGTGDQGAVSGAYFDVTNNIVVNSLYGIIGEDASPGYVSKSSIFRNNLTYGNSTNWYYNNNGTSSTIQGAGMSVTGTLTGNPVLVSPSAGNYQLGSGSPAIGTGINVGLTLDLAGNPVPSSTGVNIGAY